MFAVKSPNISVDMQFFIQCCFSIVEDAASTLKSGFTGKQTG